MLSIPQGPVFPEKDIKMPIVMDAERAETEDADVVDLVKDLGDKLASEPFYAQMVCPEELLLQQFDVGANDFIKFNALSLYLKAQLTKLEEQLMSETCGGLETYLEYMRLTNGYNAVKQLYYMGYSQTTADKVIWRGFFNRDLSYYGFALPIIREYINSQGKVNSVTRMYLEMFLIHSSENYANNDSNSNFSRFTERIRTLIQEVRS